MVKHLGKKVLKKINELYDKVKEIEELTADKDFEDTDYEDLFADISNIRFDIEDMYLRDIEKNAKK